MSFSKLRRVREKIVILSPGTSDCATAPAAGCTGPIGRSSQPHDSRGASLHVNRGETGRGCQDRVLERPSSFRTPEGRSFFQYSHGALAKLGAEFRAGFVGHGGCPNRTAIGQINGRRWRPGLRFRHCDGTARKARGPCPTRCRRDRHAPARAWTTPLPTPELPVCPRPHRDG